MTKEFFYSFLLHLSVLVFAALPGSCGSGGGGRGGDSSDSLATNILDKPQESSVTFVTLVEDEGIEQPNADSEQEEVDCSLWYGGVGYTHDFDETVSSVATGYEAERKGLRVGDRIVGVQSDNQQVRGEPGTKIILIIERDKKTMYIHMTREKICYD